MVNLFVLTVSPQRDGSASATDEKVQFLGYHLMLSNHQGFVPN